MGHMAQVVQQGSEIRQALLHSLTPSLQTP
jgi:hypothetical protein